MTYEWSKVVDTGRGQRFEDGIRQAEIFVALVGANYLKSRYAMDEWNIAREDAVHK